MSNHMPASLSGGIAMPVMELDSMARINHEKLRYRGKKTQCIADEAWYKEAKQQLRKIRRKHNKTRKPRSEGWEDIVFDKLKGD